jgi:hypothetical protein
MIYTVLVRRKTYQKKKKKKETPKKQQHGRTHMNHGVTAGIY